MYTKRYSCLLFFIILLQSELLADSLLRKDWEPVEAGSKVMKQLVNVSQSQVKGAHDAEFVCVGERAYIVAECNDQQGGENPEWPFIYVSMSVVNLETMAVENRIDFARGEQRFDNETLPPGACFVPRIVQKDRDTLRCFFASEAPGKRQSQMWFRDFDLKSATFAPTIHKAKLKTDAGIFDMQPQHFYTSAEKHGFRKQSKDYGLYLFDAFKVFDGKMYVAINNFAVGQNALARVEDDFTTFEILGHFNEPQSARLCESAINRLPDNSWMAICRNDKGNYSFTKSTDGKVWSDGIEIPSVAKGTNSKPTFDKFNGIYYLGWQESTRLEGVSRSVFNIDVSRDCKSWERKYRFETTKSFQYPSFHQHQGSVWLVVTQGDSDVSRKERIMFGRLEELVSQVTPSNPVHNVEHVDSAVSSIVEDPKWKAQAVEDAKQDYRSVPYDGISPNKLVCDTTLRELPDGSWALFMLAGDDFEPSPKNFTGVTRSFDKGKTWTPLQGVELGLPKEGKTQGQGPTELMVLGERCTLFFSTHSQTWGRDWQSWNIYSDDNCKTWSKPELVPGRLGQFTFIRNHIVAKDGRILLPFQHYDGPPANTPPPPPEEKPWHKSLSHYVSNPRNGVLISNDHGKSWTEHGNIRLTTNDRYHGWAENNIVELSDGRIAMIIRADKLGGVLYYAESTDGGLTWPAMAEKTNIPNPGSKATLYPLGGDAVAMLHNPNKSRRSPLALWISFDGMKTWPYQRVLVETPMDGPKGQLNYPDGFVSADKEWLHFAFDDCRHRAVHYSAKLPPLK